MKTKVIIIIALVLCCSCTNKTAIENGELQEAISQVWLDADTAQGMLGGIETNDLSEYEMQRYRLTEAHLMLKRELRQPAEINLDAMAKYFVSCGDEAAASEAYYIQGAYLNYIGENTQAMQYLKKAESYSATSIIRGMIYYKMGRISESEQL